MTEYSHAPFNRYVHEAGLMWGAYAALQGWDLLTQHGQHRGPLARPPERICL